MEYITRSGPELQVREKNYLTFQWDSYAPKPNEDDQAIAVGELRNFLRDKRFDEFRIRREK